MGKKKRSLSSVDYDTGIAGIIPSTQEAYSDKDFSKSIKKKESERLTQFKKLLGEKIDQDLEQIKQFPTKHEAFVFIVQYFASAREYRCRDVDNMAKSILDVLKGKFYQDDNQVKTLLVTKKMENRVPRNFACIAIKELTSDRDSEILKTAGLERSISLFQQLKKQGLI